MKYKDKDEAKACYVYKTEDLNKMKIQQKTLIVEEYNSDDGNVEDWSTDWEDEEFCKATLGIFIANGYDVVVN